MSYSVQFASTWSKMKTSMNFSIISACSAASWAKHPPTTAKEPSSCNAVHSGSGTHLRKAYRKKWDCWRDNRLYV